MPTPEPSVTTKTEYCSFEEWDSLPLVPLDTPGWLTVDCSHLYGIAPLVGDDRAVPGTDGRLPIDREFDEWPFVLEMKFNGRFDRTGEAYDERFAGVRLNMKYFRTNVLLGKTARPFKFHMEDGTVGAADVIVEDFKVAADPKSGGTLFLATLSLVIPASVLTETGP